jgi:hypothetical protein
MKGMRLLIPLFLVSTAAIAAGPDARQIMEQSLANYEKDCHAALGYNFTQREVEKTDSGQKVTVSQWSVVAGLPFEKVIARNGQPLSAEQQRKEEEKYKKFLAEYSTSQAQKRKLAEFENNRRFLREVPIAFDFELLPEQTVNGRPNYVIKCTPKPGYQPKDQKSKLFSKINAMLWVDKEDLRWTKANATVIDNVAIGWVLARIAQGAKISFQQTRVADSVWLPSQVDVNGMVKIMMVKNRPVGEQFSFSDYRLASESAPEEIARLGFSKTVR